MSKTKQEFPYLSLSDYCNKHPERFTIKDEWTIGNFIGIALGVGFVILAIKPMLINTDGIGFRIIYGIIALAALAYGLLKDRSYFNKKTGNKMKQLRSRKYKLDGEDTMEEIITAYNNDDFEAIAEVPSTSSGSLQVEVLHDKEGKFAITMILNNYYGDLNYVSDVKMFEGEQYDEYIEVLKRL